MVNDRVASIFIVELSRALADAFTGSGVPLAKIRNQSTCGASSVLSAVAEALGLKRIPNTARIAVAAGLGGVFGLATNDALRIGMETVRIRAAFFGARSVGAVAATEGFTLSGSTSDTTAAGAVDEIDFATASVGKIPFTLNVGLAIVLSDGSGTDLGADLGGVVPDAANRVDRALFSRFVMVLTLLDAFRSAELAHGVLTAIESSLEVIATLAAFLAVGAPHAFLISFAIGRVGVFVRTASEACTRAGDPFTIRVRFARNLSSCVEFATLTALVSGRIPGATHVIRILIKTLGLTLAEDALAITGAANPDIRLITRTVPFALVGVETFIETDAVEALLVTSTTVPLAVRISEAGVLDEEEAAFAT